MEAETIVQPGQTMRATVVMAIAFCLAGTMTAICLAICGASLSPIFLGFFIVTLILPPLILTQHSTRNRILIAVAVIDGTALIWLIATLGPEISLLQWLRCYVLLIAYASMLFGMSTSLTRLRIPPLAASAIMVIVSLAWLTWPVWMSAYLTGPRANAIVAWLVWVHPLFAANGVLMHLGAWSHFPIAYRELTTLGQDIPYSLPTSIWPATLLHLAIASVFICAPSVVNLIQKPRASSPA